MDRADACEVCDLVSEDVYLSPTLSPLPLSARLLAPTGPWTLVEYDNVDGVAGVKSSSRSWR